MLDAVPHRAVLGQDHRGARHRRIDVQPQPVRLGHLRDVGERIESGGRGGAGRGDDRARLEPARSIGLNGFEQSLCTHRVALVNRYDPQVCPAKACEQRGLLHGTVALARGVDDERPVGLLQAAARSAIAGGSLACAYERHQGGRRGGVLDHTAPGAGQTHHLPQPVGGELLELRESWARLPVEAELRQPGAHIIAEHGREAAVGREVAEETRILPMRAGGQDHTPQVVQDCSERLRRIRRRRRQVALDRPGEHTRHDGEHTARSLLAVIRDPVDQLMADATELFDVHVDLPSCKRSH